MSAILVILIFACDVHTVISSSEVNHSRYMAIATRRRTKYFRSDKNSYFTSNEKVAGSSPVIALKAM